KYYTPCLSEITKEIVLECEICAKVKLTNKHYGTLGIIGPAAKPYEIVHIDTKSGFSGLGSVKIHLHIAIDSFTRFVWVIASKTRQPIDFMNLVNKIIPTQKPKLIVADNYPSIRGKDFRKYLTERNIKIMFIAPNRAASNGLVERVNQTLLQRLQCKKLE